MAVSLFDLLGLRDSASPRDETLGRWPKDFVQASDPDPDALGALIEFLNAVLTFRSIRPGAFSGGAESGENPAVGLTAEVLVGAIPPPVGFVFAALPKFEFWLLETSGGPARMYLRQTSLGFELIVEALPVEIKLPERLFMPLEPKPGAEVPLEARVTDGFMPGRTDTLRVILRRDQRSSIFTHVKLRMTEQFDFLLEPAVPLSIGPCRFSGVPCRAIHDLNFILTPKPSDSLDPRAEALEWLRHDLDTTEQSDPPGFITIRTIDLNVPNSRLDDAEKQANSSLTEDQRVEAVLEDIAIPSKSLLPAPRHFLAGVRRALGVDDNPNGLYKLGDHPVVVTLMEGSGSDNSGGLYMIVEQILFRSISTEGRSNLDTSQVAFVNIAFSDDPKAKGKSVSVELTDEWTIEAGVHFEEGIGHGTLFGAEFSLTGVRTGVSFQRLFADDASNVGASAGKTGLANSLIGLCDLKIELKDEGTPDTTQTVGKPIVMLEPAGKTTTVMVNGIGYRFGDFVLGSFWDASAVDLKAAGVMRLSIDEFGFVTEPNGARYFSFSGSWPIFGKPSSVPPTPSGAATPTETKNGNSLGIQFYRLRWKIRGPRDASDLLVDGLGLSLSYGSFSLLGFGMLSDTVVEGVRYREAGIVLQVKAKIAKTELVFGGQFLHGRATGPSVDYQYLLAGLEISPIPITGAIQLVNVRGLYALNMTPKLGPADVGSAQTMRLFDWYKMHSNGVVMPASRNVSITGWGPKENAWAFAVGAGVNFGGSRALTIDAFFLYLKSPDVTGFLAALQIFLCKSKKPIAYAAVEFEGDRWSVLVGLAIGVENAIGKHVPFLSDAPVLTGTLYLTNQPSTVSIGHINDTSSWLAFHIIGDLWVFKVELFAGICLELVDLPEGPRVFGLRVSFSGGSRLCSIGGVDFYLTLEIIAGVWRNEAQVSGYVVWLEGGIEIDVLWVFQFGASVKLEWDYLGPDPAYRRIGCEVHIHTPWWMPDKTFTWNKTINQPQLEEMATISTPVIEAAAHPLAQSDAIAVAVSALVGTEIDEKALFKINDLIGIVPPQWPADRLASLVPVAIDSTIALHFKPSVDDKLVFGQITPPGAGTQASADISTRYELVEIGVRRRPRFGPGSTAWSTLLDPLRSRTDTLPNPPPQDAFRSPFGMRWDADFQREQRLDPRHLLLNAEVPYLFFTVNFENDENLVRNMPGWPCCPRFQKGVDWHTLDFQRLTVGDRAPRHQTFSESSSTLVWLGPSLPRIEVSKTQPLAGRAARLMMARVAATAFGRIQFDQAAAKVQIVINWSVTRDRRKIVISAFRGLKLVAERALPLSVAHLGPIELGDNDGITHIVFRLVGITIGPFPHLPTTDRAAAPASGSIEFISMGYQTLADVREEMVGQGKCGAVDPTIGGNGSRFAWLPNHDYEITFKTRISVKDERSGILAEEAPQVVRFRTKGLPGLNQAPRIGQEIDPYVESVYPGPGLLLYRDEPAILAFNERFDILQGLDRPVLPTDPEERKQRLDWVLAAELVAGSNEPVRATVPSIDWIVAHRASAPPPHTHAPFVLGLDPANPILRALSRSALSLDPLRLRLEAAIVSPGGCNAAATPPRKSRVLVHDPVDPSASEANQHRWPAQAMVRANMRVEGSPFIDRRRFEVADGTAFLPSDAPWQVSEGRLRPPNPAAVTQFALFGDPSWEHFQMSLAVDPGLGTAGAAIAVGAAAGSARALEVWIDEPRRALKIMRREGGSETELASAPLPNSATAPYLLKLSAYDDALKAQVGEIEISSPREDFRAGRLALMAVGPASFSSLTVDGLDAYRFEFQTSRFENFEAHIGSFRALTTIEPLGPPSASLGQLVSSNADFVTWISTRALPLRTSVERLEIGIVRTSEGAVLLIESPEPLPIGDDVDLKIFRVGSGGGGAQILVGVKTAATLRAAIAVPLSIVGSPSALPDGDYRLEFAIERRRYRQAFPDSGSNLRRVMSIHLRA